MALAAAAAGLGAMRLRHRALHLRIWLVLAALLPAILLGALALRQAGPAEPPRRLSGP